MLSSFFLDRIAQPMLGTYHSLQSPIPSVPNFGSKEANYIIYGITYGIIEENDLMSMDECLTDVYMDGWEIYQTYIDCTSGNYIRCTRNIGDAVTGFPSLLNSCDNLGKDFVELGQWADIFLNPFTIEEKIRKNVLRNSIGLTRNLRSAKKHLKDQEYFWFGVDLGNMLVLATEN